MGEGSKGGGYVRGRGERERVGFGGFCSYIWISTSLPSVLLFCCLLGVGGFRCCQGGRGQGKEVVCREEE